MTVVASLVQVFQPWQSLYSDSKAVATAVTSVHLVAMLFGGGFAVGADRATLRAAAQDAATRRRALEELGAVHRPVLLALGALFLSGFGLAAADVQTFATSPAFALKLVLVALLLANGLALTRTESRLRALAPADSGEGGEAGLWRRLRTGAWLSIGLWAATVIAGTVLVNAA